MYAPQVIPVIVGPTAGGKSAVAVAAALLARTRGITAEIITADAFQVYRGMDIGTAKPTPQQRRGVPHHLIDAADPQEPFTVQRWLALADAAIADIRSRGGAPIVVGGTHFYVKAFLEGLFQGPPAHESLRAGLLAMGPAALRAELQRADPAAAARLHPADLRRTVRALEVFRLTGTPISALQSQWDRGVVRAGCTLVGLDWNPAELNRRINARVREMMEQGLLQEVRALAAANALGPLASQALGYKQLLAHLRGELTLDDAVERIKIETRRFAKNQRTWLRRLRAVPGSIWIDMAAATPAQCAQVVVGAMATMK